MIKLHKLLIKERLKPIRCILLLGLYLLLISLTGCLTSSNDGPTKINGKVDIHSSSEVVSVTVYLYGYTNAIQNIVETKQIDGNGNYEFLNPPIDQSIGIIVYAGNSVPKYTTGQACHLMMFTGNEKGYTATINWIIDGNSWKNEETKWSNS